MAAIPDDLQALGQKALDFVADGSRVGLGTGRAASAFIRALAERVQAGLQVQAVPTSQVAAELATRLGLHLFTLDEVPQLDVAVDGADEVDPAGNLIKGYGGALVREKVVAAAATQLVILVGEEKLVPVLGSRGILPVEVLPFAACFCQRRLAQEGISSQVRMGGGNTVLTDNVNYVLDCQIKPVSDPAALEVLIRSIPGVVGTGLFLSMRPIVLFQRNQEIAVRVPTASDSSAPYIG